MRKLKPLVRTLDARAVRPQPKQVDPFYLTPEYRAWRAKVITKAGHRCEAINDDGSRCHKAEPAHRLFADHIVELQDGGAALDVRNGRCLCGSHHTAKTAQARATRLRS